VGVMMEVRPVYTRCRAAQSAVSVSESMEAVASSRIRNQGGLGQDAGEGQKLSLPTDRTGRLPPAAGHSLRAGHEVCVRMDRFRRLLHPGVVNCLPGQGEVFAHRSEKRKHDPA
jgi:hypothetical protein